MLLSIRVFLVFILFVVSIVGCTGNNSAGKPMNGDGSLGNKPRNFFHAETDSSISIVHIEVDGTAARLRFDAASQLQNQGAIASNLIRLSVDGKFLTLLGEPQVFELQAITPDSLGKAGVVVPAPTIEAICLLAPFQSTQNLSGTSYREIHITQSSSGYQFLGVQQDGRGTVLGSATAFAQKQDLLAEVDYTKDIGNLALQLGAPSSEDPAYFQTRIQFPSDPNLSSVQNLYCHSNRSAVTVSPSLSTVALGAATSGWGGAENAGLNDGGLVALASVDTSYYQTDSLDLTGYFASPSRKIPTNATVDGVGVKCNWAASNSAAPNSFTLLKAGQVEPAARNTIFFSNPFSPLTPTLSLSSEFGGPSNLLGYWGVALTPSDVNDPGFGIRLTFEAHHGPFGFWSSTVSVDYCQVSVFWH